MLKQALNELEIPLILHADSPLLIKDGRFGDEERKAWCPDTSQRKFLPSAVPISRASLPDLKAAVLARDPVAAVGLLPFYLPGTSLRGSWRSYLERTLRGADPADKPRVCDPLAVGKREGDDPEEGVVVNALDASCSWELDRQEKKFAKLPPPERRGEYRVYAYSCPICRLFGSTVQASRLSVTDGECIPGTGSLIVREHVRIMRHTGQVAKGGPLKFFALKDAQFAVTLRLRNFELWQVRLVGILLAQLKNKLIPVGSGKSKGYGYIRAEVRPIQVTCFSAAPPPEILWGIAEHSSAPQGYGLQPPLEVPFESGTWQSNVAIPWRYHRTLTSGCF